MLINCSRIMVLLMILCAPLAVTPVAAEDLASYARTCNREVRVPVEGFDCTKGEEIPMVGGPGGTCQNPPYLPTAPCRAGSRFGVQVATPEYAVVWLCRKTRENLEADDFDDIAVIQTNFENGATCFYQHFGKINGTKVPAPERDNRNFWKSPAETADEECASCHDSGLLRTPYLTQLGNYEHWLDRGLRHSKNYWFPGDDFAGWNGQVYKLKLSGELKKACGSCHVMGANTIDRDFGTSSWLGPMATGLVETPHLAGTHGATAFWMKRGLDAPDPASQNASKLIRDCALQENGTVPGCVKKPWGPKDKH